jgi:hypothetical protein
MLVQHHTQSRGRTQALAPDWRRAASRNHETSSSGIGAYRRIGESIREHWWIWSEQVE